MSFLKLKKNVIHLYLTLFEAVLTLFTRAKWETGTYWEVERLSHMTIVALGCCICSFFCICSGNIAAFINHKAFNICFLERSTALDVCLLLPKYLSSWNTKFQNQVLPMWVSYGWYKVNIFLSESSSAMLWHQMPLGGKVRQCLGEKWC